MSDIDDEFVPEEEAGNPAETIKKLRERLRTAQQESKENLEGWQRAKADYLNLKRDEEVRRGHTTERVRAEFAEAMLPALDAAWLAQKGEWFANASTQLQTGIKYIGGELARALETFGIKLIAALPGEDVDLKTYEIIRETPTDDEQKDHTIEEVLRPGLSIGEHVIRPAQVSAFVYKK